MLKRVKYISRAARPMTLEDIDRLAEQSVHYNMDHGITGVLMYSGGIFFQEIEGLREHVDALLEKIGIDQRHTHVVMLGCEEGVKERLFPDWAMEKINLDESSNERLEPLGLLLEVIATIQDDPRYEELVERVVGAIERAIWTELISESG